MFGTFWRAERMQSNYLRITLKKSRYLSFGYKLAIWRCPEAQQRRGGRRRQLSWHSIYEVVDTRWQTSRNWFHEPCHAYDLYILWDEDAEPADCWSSNDCHFRCLKAEDAYKVSNRNGGAIYGEDTTISQGWLVACLGQGRIARRGMSRRRWLLQFGIVRMYHIRSQSAFVPATDRRERSGGVAQWGFLSDRVWKNSRSSNVASSSFIRVKLRSRLFLISHSLFWPGEMIAFDFQSVLLIFDFWIALLIQCEGRRMAVLGGLHSLTRGHVLMPWSFLSVAGDIGLCLEIKFSLDNHLELRTEHGFSNSGYSLWHTENRPSLLPPVSRVPLCSHIRQ